MIDCTKTASISDNITWTTATTGTVNYIPMSTSTATITTTNVNDLIQEAVNCVNSFADKRTTFAVKNPEFHPEWNCKPNVLKHYNPMTVGNEKPAIVNIDIIVPNKVVEVTIFDGKEYKYKQICREPDEFDFKYALALAWAKYQDNWTNNYHLTIEGLEKVAYQYLHYYKETNNEFERAIKAYNNWIKEEAKKEAEEAERKAIIERRRAKNKKRKEKMAMKKKQAEIDIISEAIKKSKENKYYE